ncbi:MAG: Txe/YoeB family addiction module toxin [Lachnospiraceae bacterium]|nr:Txe/YoeB family addiction module toxin [Lachnospiraceae bacterium]
MNKKWMDAAWDDYLYWQTLDKKTQKRINKLILDIERNGNMHGIGKPEPLQYDLQGYFSRRIDDQNRLVYVVDDTGLNIISCRYHYD